MSATLLFFPIVIGLFFLVWIQVSAQRFKRQKDKLNRPENYLGKNAFHRDDVQQAVDALEVDTGEK